MTLTLTQIESRLKKWKSKAKRAANAIDKLERQRRRLDRKIIRDNALRQEQRPTTVTDVISVPQTSAGYAKEYPPMPLADIPGFLERSKERDAAIKAEVQAEVDSRKQAKAEQAVERRKIKKEVLDADLAGKRRKMPLSGKAALAAIRRK